MNRITPYKSLPMHQPFHKKSGMPVSRTDPTMTAAGYQSPESSVGSQSWSRDMSHGRPRYRSALRLLYARSRGKSRYGPVKERWQGRSEPPSFFFYRHQARTPPTGVGGRSCLYFLLYFLLRYFGGNLGFLKL